MMAFDSTERMKASERCIGRLVQPQGGGEYKRVTAVEPGDGMWQTFTFEDGTRCVFSVYSTVNFINEYRP